MRVNDGIRGLHRHLDTDRYSLDILKILINEGRVSSSELKERLSISQSNFVSTIIRLSSYDILEREYIHVKRNGKYTHVSYWNIKSELIDTVKRYVGQFHSVNIIGDNK